MSKNNDLNTCSITVIMSIYYEEEAWLIEAIDSILNQTFPYFEFIIINDNPERELNKAILKEYQLKDKRIVIITNEVNIGLTKSLNVGLKIAKGKYIARMDADDISVPTRFEIQFNYLESNIECIVCGGYVENFGLSKRIRKYPLTHKKCLNELIINSCFAHPTVMFRNNHITQYDKLYNEEFKQSQDYRLWVDLIGLGEFHNIPAVLLKYRITEQQVSNLNKKSQQNFAKICREIALNKLLRDKVAVTTLLNQKYSAAQIKKISLKFKEFKNLSPLLWLSLNEYKIPDFFEFLFSKAFLNCSIQQNLAVLKRSALGPDKLI